MTTFGINHKAMRKENFTPIIFRLLLWCIVWFPLGAASQDADSFAVVGIHPAASLQGSVTGKQLLTLFPWNGKIYAGYGDYGNNTGPIPIYAFHPDSMAFIHEWTANTEAIYNYRALNGMLYAPAIDRKSYGMPGDYTKMDSSGIWADYNFGSNSTHTFDAISMNDSVLFMMGSQDTKATVWRSINNGQTWNKILTDTAISGIAGDFARFYFGGVLDGKLYVQARDFNGPMHPNSKVYDGVSWANGPSLFPSLGSLGWRPEAFAGKLVYRSWEPGSSSRLRSFDGTDNAWVDSMWVYDGFVHANHYYALVDSGYGVRNIRRTTDLVNWENLPTATTNSRSLAILDDYLYVGTTDSKLLRYTKPLTAMPSAVSRHYPATATVTIYPNPANDIIQLVFSAPIQHFELELWNARGEIVLKAWNQNRLDVSALSRGMYYIRLKEGNRYHTQKFILQ